MAPAATNGNMSNGRMANGTSASKGSVQQDQWSSKAYNGAASFVPQLTEKVLEYLDPQPTENIIDVGCGDGVLSAKIAARCNHLFGLDSSQSFIQTARETVHVAHPNTDFIEADCKRLTPDACETDSSYITWALKAGYYDKVFSNAAMHWILRDEQSRKPFFKDINWLLKPGGKFVFEMGGFGNVLEAHTALTSVLKLEYGVSTSKLRRANPWFFPSPDWMRKTLDEAGFDVEIVESEPRPTRLTPHTQDGSGGLEGWLRLMGAQFLNLLAEEDRDDAVDSMCEILEPIVTRVEDGSQWLSYVRLRAVATKKA